MFALESRNTSYLAERVQDRKVRCTDRKGLPSHVDNRAQTQFSRLTAWAGPRRLSPAPPGGGAWLLVVQLLGQRPGRMAQGRAWQAQAEVQEGEWPEGMRAGALFLL